MLHPIHLSLSPPLSLFTGCSNSAHSSLAHFRHNPYKLSPFTCRRHDSGDTAAAFSASASAFAAAVSADAMKPPTPKRPFLSSPTTDPSALHPAHPRRGSLRRRLRCSSTTFLSSNKWSFPSNAGRRSGPATPLLKWKFEDAEAKEKVGASAGGAGGNGRRKNKIGEGERVRVSARTLAAGIWQLQVTEAARAVAGTVGLEPVHGHLQAPHLCNLERPVSPKHAEDGFSSSFPVSNARNDALYKLDASRRLPNPAMERATKWDPGFSKASDEVYRLYGHLKLLEDQQVTTVSVISSLQAKLEQSRARISELEDERKSSKKKLDHFLKKLCEDKAAWRSREHEKIRSVIDDLKDGLNREKKNRQRLEVMNSKLVNELTETNLSAKRYLQDCEKERKARELMEEVCDELAKEIGEDKAEVEALRRECLRIREEVEEERKMLQMAEVWREERVQMKLVDAKLTLENKYVQITKLQAALEAFLRLSSGSDPTIAEIREAECLSEAVKSVNVHEIKEFFYQPPPASEDIFSVFEELQPTEEANLREIGSCYNFSLGNHESNVHSMNPEINVFHEIGCENGMIDDNEDIEDDSGWETVSNADEQRYNNSLDGSDRYVNGTCLESNASASGTEWEEISENGKLKTEITEICSPTTKGSTKRTSSISRLWKLSNNDSRENIKIVAVEATNDVLANRRRSNGTLSPEHRSAEVGLSPPSIGPWSSPESMNPHITRGMKGCIEWPRGAQRHSLKAKLLEARMGSQKIQLRQALKHKI